MRHAIAVCAILLFTAGVCAAQEPPLPAQKDKASYLIGMFVGKDMAAKGVDLNADIFVKGFKDGISGAKPAIADKEAQAVMETFNKDMAARRKAEMTAAASQEEKFLTANKSKPGVKTLPSGLQYKVLKEGAGPKPTLYDKVTVNYRGTLLSGAEFDSSYKRGQPATFPVNGIIPGWSEALQLMNTGAKYQLVIPAKLAYGPAGVEGVIPPNSTLIFEVELISIADQKSDGKAAPGAAKPAKPATK